MRILSITEWGTVVWVDDKLKMHYWDIEDFIKYAM